MKVAYKRSHGKVTPPFRNFGFGLQDFRHVELHCTKAAEPRRKICLIVFSWGSMKAIAIFQKLTRRSTN